MYTFKIRLNFTAWTIELAQIPLFLYLLTHSESNGMYSVLPLFQTLTPNTVWISISTVQAIYSK